MADVIKEVGEQLSRIFRHMLPGILVVASAKVAYPTWFTEVIFSDPWHIAILTAIAVAVGNAWYAFHRYTIHQVIDWFVYIIWHRERRGYIKWVADLIRGHCCCPDDMRRVRDHLWLRSSQIILMFIVGESLVIFAHWHQPGSVFDRHECLLFWTGVAMLVGACVQYYISIALEVALRPAASSPSI